MVSALSMRKIWRQVKTYYCIHSAGCEGERKHAPIIYVHILQEKVDSYVPALENSLRNYAGIVSLIARSFTDTRVTDASVGASIVKRFELTYRIT